MSGYVATSKPTVTVIPDIGVSTLFAAVSTNFREVIIQNNSSANLYIKFGSSVSTSDYSAKLAAGDALITQHLGSIYGIWDGDVGGFANITELQL